MFGGQSFHQIGTDQGLLSAPVPVKVCPSDLGSAPTWSLNFGQRGKQPRSQNDSLKVMQFRVAAKDVRDESALPQTLRPVPKLPSRRRENACVNAGGTTGSRAAASPDALEQCAMEHAGHRESQSGYGRDLEPHQSTEDVHPIHLHLVRFQILDRRPFDKLHYLMTGDLRYIGGHAFPRSQARPAGKTRSAPIPNGDANHRALRRLPGGMCGIATSWSTRTTR